MEKLIPFDFAEFKKDPSRLRWHDGLKPVRASVALDDSVCAVWGTGRHAQAYLPFEFSGLRLAAKTRKVMVRMFDYGQGRAGSVSSDISSIAGPTALGGQRWVSDIIEVEVTE